MAEHHHPHDHKHASPGDEHHCSTKPSALLTELREHVPFSVSAVAIGLIVAGAICVLADSIFAGDGPSDQDTAPAAHDPEHDHEDQHQGTHDTSHSADSHAGHVHGPDFARSFFHLFHPAHMLFSGAATAAMFVRYDRRAGKAFIVGIIGALGVCGISDIVMPHVSLLLLGMQPAWHICVVEHPGMALPFAAVGVLVGVAAAGGVARSTIISHSLHVLTSTMASIFYMVGPLGVVAWIDRIGVVFLFVIVAVVTPCCLSDIVFPMLMTQSGRKQYEAEPHAH